MSVRPAVMEASTEMSKLPSIPMENEGNDGVVRGEPL